MTIPQSFLDGDTLANALLPMIAQAEKKTEIVLEFWAGLIGRQLGYMASAVGREDTLQLMDVLREQLDMATVEIDTSARRKIKASLSIVKSTVPHIEDADPQK